MKILLTNATAYPTVGGIENSLSYIGRELLHAGHEVKIFCFQFSPDEPLRMDHEGIEIIRYPCKAHRWPHMQLFRRITSIQLAIPDLFAEFQPDMIWSRSAPMALGVLRTGYQGCLFQIYSTNARMNCRGLFLQTHGLPLSRRLMLLGLWPSAYLVSYGIERRLARQCDGVVFSENMRRRLLEDFPVDARTCHVIPPGVDSEFFSPEKGAQQFDAVESRYGLSRGEPIVLYVGRLSSAKNIPLLMNALRVLKNGTKLVLVGSGPEESRLKDYAREIGVADRVVFAGMHRELLPGFYAISRVCVLPTIIESFGQVYLEALASGTPVIGFAGDGRRVLTATEEIIKDGETGYAIKKVDTRVLADAIDSILSLDSTAYAVMSQRARDDVRNRFSWRRFVTAMLALSTRDELIPV
jgi:glycosyltransferase involved in cell wall biosynthesis